MANTITDDLMQQGYSIDQEGGYFFKYLNTRERIDIPFSAIGGYDVASFALFLQNHGDEFRQILIGERWEPTKVYSPATARAEWCHHLPVGNLEADGLVRLTCAHCQLPLGIEGRGWELANLDSATKIMMDLTADSAIQARRLVFEEVVKVINEDWEKAHMPVMRATLRPAEPIIGKIVRLPSAFTDEEAQTIEDLLAKEDTGDDEFLTFFQRAAREVEEMSTGWIKFVCEPAPVKKEQS